MATESWPARTQGTLSTSSPAERTEVGGAPVPLRPGLEALTQGLESIWGEPVTVLDRRPNPYGSTFPAEIITCTVADRDFHRVFCKHTGRGGYNDHGHRGGVEYEAEVYRQILQGLPVPVPAFHGTFACPEAGTCLVLQYLEDGIRVSKLPVPNAMPAAAAWAGHFHAWNEARLRQLGYPFLTSYDADYYAGWSRRTLRYASGVMAEHPWLSALCRQYEDRIPILTARPRTIIHGEYTPHNVLWQDGRIYPTDWESAAMAAGEIDLAILVEGWDEKTVEHSVQSYRQARGPTAASADFEEALAVAQLYVLFRWLAAPQKPPAAERSQLRLQHLKRLAERMGLL